MTNVKFDRKEFEKQIKLTPEIIEKISLFGTPLESLTEEEVEIEVFPNRPDLISFQGFIQGFKAFLGKETEVKKYQVNKPKENYIVKIDKSVKNVRPFTACSIVTNLEFDDKKIKQIIDLQEKLHFTVGRNRKKVAIGIYPLEKISLPIKYEARDPEKIKFIPLESDKEMTGRQILTRHPKGKDFAHLLEKEDLYPVFVDAKGKILSMPPIINSHETGKITIETKEVFVECSGSHMPTLMKTLNIIVTTLAAMNGKIFQMELQYENKIVTPNLTPEKIKLNLNNVNKLLGLSLKEKDLEKLLPMMGYEYKSGSVIIPAWRTDILHEVDLIEDIAIAYGYDKLTPEMPTIATVGAESLESKTVSKISEILIGLGLMEVSSYHLIKEREAEISKTKKIELENSKTEYNVLRPNLLIPALRILSENKDNDYPQGIFEIGTVFSIDEGGNTDTGIKENENLIVAVSPGNYTRVKQILDYFGESFDKKFEVREKAHKQLIDGRSAEILADGKEIGYIGEIHPETLREWGIKMPVSVLEISLEEIFEIL